MNDACVKCVTSIYGKHSGLNDVYNVNSERKKERKKDNDDGNIKKKEKVVIRSTKKTFSHLKY